MRENAVVLMSFSNILSGVLVINIFEKILGIDYMISGLMFVIFFALLVFMFSPTTLILTILPYVAYYIWTISQADLLFVHAITNYTIIISSVYLALRISSFIHLKKRENFLKNKTIKALNAKVEAQNRSIQESIKYAERIQKAILPTKHMFNENFEESFALYLPKDTISGDFLWFKKQEDTLFFAVADCTGHGIPGAMLSMVCGSCLDFSVDTVDALSPSKILNNTRQRIFSLFGNAEDKIKDGMDISLCLMKENKLWFSGANSDLWMVRSASGELEIDKGQRHPIGKYENLSPFEYQEIDLEKGDHLYLFTDGYVDQFGGENDKKYKTSQLKNFLLSIQDAPLSTHGELLKSEHLKWKGAKEQIDDICFLGVKH